MFRQSHFPLEEAVCKLVYLILFSSKAHKELGDVLVYQGNKAYMRSLLTSHSVVFIRNIKVVILKPPLH